MESNTSDDLFSHFTTYNINQQWEGGKTVHQFAQITLNFFLMSKNSTSLLICIFLFFGYFRSQTTYLPYCGHFLQMGSGRKGRKWDHKLFWFDWVEITKQDSPALLGKHLVYPRKQNHRDSSCVQWQLKQKMWLWVSEMMVLS